MRFSNLVKSNRLTRSRATRAITMIFFLEVASLKL